MTHRVGGVGKTKPATPAVQELVSGLRDSIEEKAGKKFSVFEVISYASQVVNGTNYFVKIKVGADSYIHVRIYKPLGGRQPEVVKMQRDQTLTSEITYF